MNPEDLHDGSAKVPGGDELGAVDGKSAPGAPEIAPPSPEPPAGAPRPERPRLSPEALEALRAGRRKRRVLAFGLSLMAVAAVLAVVLADGVLSSRYKDLYYEQPWLRILRTYGRIEEGSVLSIHRNQLIEKLENEILAKQVYAIGFVTSLEPVEEEGRARLRLLLDAPSFSEPVNLFEDDVRVDLPPEAASGLVPGQLVIARGTGWNFSRWGLWISEGAARPLTAIERWYVRKCLPPTKHTRETLGFDRLLQDKEKRE